MTKTPPAPAFGGPPSEATNHVEHTTTDEMPEFVAASTLRESEKAVKGWRSSIYKFYFPLVAANGETRNPYQCVRHMLAIIGKHCSNRFKVLPKNDNDDKNEPIAIWTDFPSSKEAATAYLFNIRYPQQNFGQRSGAVDFVTELRVSTTHSASWLKQQSTLVTEFKRHKYWLKAREDAPTVPIRPIIWLGGPDPDNCSTANLRALLQHKAPTADFLHLEKHRLTSRPDGQKKVFVTHVLKVSAPTDAAWSTSRQLLQYLNNIPDDQKPVQLQGVKGVPMSNKDISKPELAAAITEQNKYLDHSAAVQIVNVWKLDTKITITDALMEAFANFDLEEMMEPEEVRPFIQNPVDGQTTIRDLLYAMVLSRPDISSTIIRDDYIRGRSWNLVCDSDTAQQVVSIASIFLGALNRALSPTQVAQICGSNAPHSIDKQPRVEYVKQYEDDGTVLQPTFGTNLKAFSAQYGVPLQTPAKNQTTDFSRPPRATFAQAHLHRTRVVGADRASWAAVVYKAAFDKDEPKKNPFHNTRRNKQPTRQSQHSTQSSQTTHTTNQDNVTPATQPTDEPTAAPAQPTQTPTTPETQTDDHTPPQQQTSKIDDMEKAIAAMQASEESLNTTIKKLETNVDKISASVETIAKSQQDLQTKFESFLETTTADKKFQQKEIAASINESMHEHVYPQLNALFQETNDRLAYLETMFESTAESQGSYESDSEDDEEDTSCTPMDTSTSTDVTGHKHRGSPSRQKQTPPPKRASRSLTFSPAATPGRSAASYFPASQDLSGFTEQSQLSGGDE